MRRSKRGRAGSVVVLWLLAAAYIAASALAGRGNPNKWGGAVAPARRG